MSIIKSPTMMIGVAPPHPIDQSIRFNDADNPKLGKTFSGAGTEETWTFSCWIKLGVSTSNGRRMIFSAGSAGSNYGGAELGSTGDDSLEFYNYVSSSYAWRLRTTQQFRDPSAWYHLVFVSDTTNAVSTERARIYVNGQRVTDFSTASYPSLNYPNNFWMGTTEHEIGTSIFTTQNFDGYMAEIVNLDGTATDCNSFAEFNSSGIWVPKDVSGLTFGTNGFHIKGETASDLGNDSSGNNNDFAVSGINSHDQVSDSPTNNFCTINSVYADNAPASNAGTLSNGNLQYVGTNSTFSVKGFTFDLPKTGKWYFEYTIGGNSDGFGFVVQGEQGSINASNGPGNVSVAQGGGIQYRGWRNGGNYTVTFSDYASSSFSAGELHQVAIDVDNGKWYYGIANTYYANDGGTDGNPSAGTNHLTTFDFANNDVVLLAGNYTGTQHWNFGQNGTFNGTKTAQGNSDANGIGNFYYAVPTGYLALCSKNVGS